MFERHASFRTSLVPAGGGLLYVTSGEYDDCQFIGLDWALETLRERMTGLDGSHLSIAPRGKWLAAASVAPKQLPHS